MKRGVVMTYHKSGMENEYTEGDFIVFFFFFGYYGEVWNEISMTSLR